MVLSAKHDIPPLQQADPNLWDKQDQLLRRFERWLRDSPNYSRASTRNYAYAVRRVVRVLSLPLMDAGAHHLLGALPSGRSPEYHNHMLQALGAFDRFIKESGTRKRGLPLSDMRRARAPRHLPRPYSNEERGRYLAAAKALSQRHYVLACLGVYAGLRLHEAVKVQWADLSDGRLRVEGKGGKVGYVPVGPQLAEALSRWQPECPSQTWVLAPAAGDDRKVHPATGLKWHHAILERAGMRRHEPGLDGYHRTRHTAGTGFYRASGRDIIATQKFLRHESITSTAVYAYVDDEDVTGPAGKMFED